MPTLDVIFAYFFLFLVVLYIIYWIWDKYQD